MLSEAKKQWIQSVFCHIFREQQSMIIGFLTLPTIRLSTDYATLIIYVSLPSSMSRSKKIGLNECMIFSLRQIRQLKNMLSVEHCHLIFCCKSSKPTATSSQK